MEEKDYALISDRELVDRLLIGDEEIVRYLFFDKCTPMFNYILHRFCPCQLDKNELINELYLYLQSDNWYKLRQFDFRSKLTTWLTVVAVRFFQKRKGVLMDYRNQSAPIKEEEKVLAEINNLEAKKNSLHTQIQQFVKEIVNRHIEYKKEIDKLVDSLKVEYDGLSISVTKEFQKEEMKSFLESRCNLRGIERQQYIANLVSRYDSDIETQAYTLIKDLLNEKVEFKNSYASPNVASEFFSKNWYALSYQLSYQGDLFEMMSEGKQAFVILKLLLEFSDKKCPILIDQPEDSLDNRAIYQELVEYIKAKKKDRQIVLVTHNSNVVVSADAENVIVANQEGSNSHNYGKYKFQYINGALERTKKCNPAEAIILESQGIREHVCDILEGGKVAFEKREQKYGFGKYANSNN